MKSPVRLAAGIGACLCIIALLSACPQGEVSVAAPELSSTQLDPMYRLSFHRQNQLKTSEGGNLAAHDVFSDPSVLFENGKYRMWFTAANKPHTDSQEMGISYAESDDGVTWTPRLDSGSGEPELLLKPTAGGWDAGGVETPHVLKAADGRYLMYYSGDVPPAGSHSWGIGLAVSDDGFTWSKVGEGPIMDGRGDWEGPFFEGSGKNRKRVGGVAEPSVVYDSEAQLYRMWYSALGHKNEKIAFRIGYATSTDGVQWEKHQDPVFEPAADGAWDDAVVSHTNVVFHPVQGYHMFYFGTSAENYRRGEENGAAMMTGSIGHAFSRDGVTWERDANPVLSVVPDSWEAWTVGGPSSVIQDDEVKLWYFATAVHNKFSFRMGLATARLTPSQ